MAHQTLFVHRHPEQTPDFHFEIIADLHGPSRRVIELAFRGAGKSTLAEEYIVLDAAYQRFGNFIIVGESLPRAIERLASIKREFEYNEHLQILFGSLVGPTWNEDKIILANGVVIQAFGRGQSLRGTKHLDQRPDACLIDDLENEESVGTPEQRDKTEGWLLRTLLPALEPGAKVRMLANMLDPDCLAVRLRKTNLWTVREYPWEYVDRGSGSRAAMWPSRFPLKFIDETKLEYLRTGRLNEYEQEYMVQPIDPSTRAFKTEHIKVEAQVRSWQPVYAMYDPARTVKQTSAHTGVVVFSWVGTRLIVWDAWGEHWLPGKIIDHMFEVHETYAPVQIGIEKEGLEEFIMQPLRVEQIKRHTILPVSIQPAPQGKLDFIRSLQPFFVAGDVVFAKDLPVLKEQLLSFPTGRIDVPNALAYALRMRPGLPVYENFTSRHVVENPRPVRDATTYLALNATRQYTTAVLTQFVSGSLRLLGAWVREGDPGTSLGDILTEAKLITPRYTTTAGPEHWKTYDAVGMQPAARRADVRLTMGGAAEVGREEIRKRLDAVVHGNPSIQVSTRARWALNAFAGGYARSVVKGKPIEGAADDGPYKVLMEGFESFAAVVVRAMERDGDDKPNYATDARGRKFLSARATHHR